MSTKDQERQALEKIREILEGLGEDSYLGTAFEGCLDDAETNIENDWALSMNGRWQDAEQKIEALKAELFASKKNNDLLRERAEKAEALYNQEQGIADGLREKWHTAQDQAHELADMCAERDLQIGGLEEEIIHLKAKLYDMMTGA